MLNFTEVKEMSSEKIELIEKLVSRLALQIDTQTEQKEITSQKIPKSIDIFMDNYKDFTQSNRKLKTEWVPTVLESMHSFIFKKLWYILANSPK
jgi:hypothetical protein